MRNDYAFSDLTVEQVRTYNRLPKPFGDVWLQSGCSERVLFWTESEKDLQRMPMMQMDFRRDRALEQVQLMIDAGLSDRFPLMESASWRGSANHVAEKMQEVWQFYQFEDRFCTKGGKWADEVGDDAPQVAHKAITHAMLRPYTKHLLAKKHTVRDEYLMRHALKDLINDGTFISDPGGVRRVGDRSQ